MTDSCREGERVCFILYFMAILRFESVTNARDGFVMDSPFLPYFDRGAHLGVTDSVTDSSMHQGNRYPWAVLVLVGMSTGTMSPCISSVPTI